MVSSNWIENFQGYSRNNPIKKDIGKYESYGYWTLNNQQFHGNTNLKYAICTDETVDYVVAYHSKCCDLLESQQVMPSNKKLWDLIENQEHSNSILGGNFYDGIEQYHGQDFDWVSCMKDENMWMVKDPIRNKLNGERIINIWKNELIY